MRALVLSGAAYLAAMIGLAVSAAPLGSPGFFACVAVAVAAFAVLLALIWRSPADTRTLFLLGILFAVAFRIPLALPHVNSDNDMIRYVWDGRLQTLGINPYGVLPADESVAFAHTDETRAMPSARHRSPYPPAAQLFFRLIVSLHDSGRAMKLALIACDLLTMVVIWRALLATGRNEVLTLAYAWNPLVVLEVAHSGHIDALGALWIATSVFWLVRHRTSLATIAFVLAVTTKLLPIVLVPLLWRRITPRDAMIGAGLLLLLYAPFWTGPEVLVGIQNVVQHIRFNGPAFRMLSALSSPEWAARTAVGLGLLTAIWCRWRLKPDDPVAWAMPMAVAIALAPVVYPWYLLYLTPFLVVPRLLPILVWCVTVLMTYVVWYFVATGGRWVVPTPVLIAEYAIPLIVAGAVAIQLRRAGWREPAAAGHPTGPAQLP